MRTLTTVVFAWAAAALLAPGSSWASRETLCSGGAVFSGAVEARAEIGRVAVEVEENAGAVLDHSDILAMRGSHPFALHWTSHAVKLEDLNKAVTATARAWCRLAELPDVYGLPGKEQFGTRLANVLAETEKVRTMLQGNRLAHMGSEYQRKIQQIREHARQLNAQAAGLAQAARSRQRSGGVPTVATE